MLNDSTSKYVYTLHSLKSILDTMGRGRLPRCQPRVRGFVPTLARLLTKHANRFHVFAFVT
jgi:hypothetical protein